MHEPLYTAAEMRAAEERYPGYPGSAGELMERAGAAVAAEVLRAFPEARRIAAVCGGGANGGDGRIAARILRESGRDVVETDDPSNVDRDDGRAACVDPLDRGGRLGPGGAVEPGSEQRVGDAGSRAPCRPPPCRRTGRRTTRPGCGATRSTPARPA